MITQIRLKNCQSWDDITIDLATDRLNVIVADNDTGKSVLYKILKLVGSPKFYGRSERRELIRWGCTHAVAAFAFSNGRLGIVTISESQVVYEYIKEDGARNPVLSPPQELLEDVGLLVNPEGTFIANIIDGDQDLMLVNSNLANNFELIKMIVMSEDLDSLSEKIKMLTTEFSSYRVRVCDQKNVLGEQLGALKHYDIEKMEREMQHHEALYEGLKKLTRVWRHLEKFDEIEFRDFSALECFLGSLEQLVCARRLLKSLELSGVPVDDCFIRSLELLSKVKECAEKLAKPDKVMDERFIDAFDGLLSASSRLGKLAVAEFDFSKFDQMLQGLEALIVARKYLEVYAQAVKKLECARQDIRRLEKMFSDSGVLVDCPIYGKVVFDGKNCVVSN